MVYIWSLVFLSLWQFLMPLGMRWYSFRWKISKGYPLNKKSVYSESRLLVIRKSSFFTCVAFEVCLSLMILSACLLVLLAFLGVLTTVGPLVYKVDISDLVMCQPMTTGQFLYIISLGGIPWIFFHYAGIPSIRDAHQHCKEMRDCSFQVCVALKNLCDNGFTKVFSSESSKG